MNNDTLVSGLAERSFVDDSQNNPIMNDLKHHVMMKKFIENDKPLEDATLTMLAAAQGPAGLAAYGSTVGNWMHRIVNGIKTKDPRRFAGIPRKGLVREAITDKNAREKLLWTATGNGMKWGQTSQTVAATP